MTLPLDTELISILHLISLTLVTDIPLESIITHILSNSKSAFYLSVPHQLDSASAILFSSVSYCQINWQYLSPHLIQCYNSSRYIQPLFLSTIISVDFPETTCSIFYLHAWFILLFKTLSSFPYLMGTFGSLFSYLAVLFPCVKETSHCSIQQVTLFSKFTSSAWTFP